MMFNFNYIVWDAPELAFSILGIGVRYYSLCWCIGLLLGYYVAKKLYKLDGIKEELFEPLFIYCFMGILVGARLGHCLFYQPDYYLANPLEIVLPFQQTTNGWKFTGFTGLASHGGTLGLIIALWLYVRKTKLELGRVLDIIGITTPIVACFIRIGNLVNSEIVGKPTDVPWAFIFKQVDDYPRHPGQLYEAIAYLIFFGVGIWLYRKYKEKLGSGYFFGFCLTAIFTFRFLIEYIKEDQVNFESTMFFNMGQLLSIPFIALGLYYMMRGRVSKK